MSPEKASQLCEFRDETGLTFLACALGYNAPIDVIHDVMKVDPSLARVKDVHKATALHVACLNGARIDAIDLVVSQYPDLVTQLDGDLRCPLHHAVEYACLYGHEGYSYLDVIEILSSKESEMIYSVDKIGDTPVDIIQSFKQKFSVKSSEYHRLQIICDVLRERGIEHYKEKKKKWETEGYKESNHWNHIDKDVPCTMCTYSCSSSTGGSTTEEITL